MPIIGTESNVSKFNRDDLNSYVDQNYNVNNFCIVASGAVEHTKIVTLAEKYLLSCGC